MATWKGCSRCGWHGSSNLADQHVCVDGEQPKLDALRPLTLEEALVAETIKRRKWRGEGR